MEAKLGSVAMHADIALALAIILLMAQIIMTILLFKVWRNGRPSRRPDDAERGLELQDAPRRMPTGNTSRSRSKNPPMPTENTGGSRSRNPRMAAPAPVGRSPAEAHGRPVPAYHREETRTRGGENEDYYNPTPISRRPTYTVDSGRGQQTQGADYTKERREGRFEDRHNTNVNNANYGRKGNKFAHGT
ncbi:hypothetical protein F5883DRAFT_521888 [Diaporthe sp. PMI_573]|nr:hypothetical protein F5883DRAFT_521888 [Diaporthaceae sp. PMI_573]